MSNTKGSFKRWLRQIIGPGFREMSRSGKIVQTLWDAAQIQAQQREYHHRIGEITIALIREGKLQNTTIERIVAKLDRSERILKRQEAVLRSYQNRADIREIMREDRQLEKDGLESISGKEELQQRS